MVNKILIMTAVEAEREAVLRGIRGDSRFDVQIAGVGPVAAAVNTTVILTSSDHSQYDMVVSAGIGGGFADQAALEIVRISRKGIPYR